MRCNDLHGFHRVALCVTRRFMNGTFYYLDISDLLGSSWDMLCRFPSPIVFSRVRVLLGCMLNDVVLVLLVIARLVHSHNSQFSL